MGGGGGGSGDEKKGWVKGQHERGRRGDVGNYRDDDGTGRGGARYYSFRARGGVSRTIEERHCSFYSIDLTELP